MADNDDLSKNQNEDALDDELELDLFDETESDPLPDDTLSTQSQTKDSTDQTPESGGNELHDDLQDDLQDDLDGDFLDITDEEVQAEFAALDMEDLDDLGNDEQATPPGPDNALAEDHEASPEQFGIEQPDEDFTVSLSAAEQEVADAIGDTGIDADPDLSDDLDFDITQEKFTAPDQDVKSAARKSKSDGKTPKEGIMALGNNLPAVLASLATLSPKVIVAVTAAVLLPVVIFTVLGFNSSDSDAQAQTPEPTFTDGTDESSLATSASQETPESEPSPAEDAEQTLPERPQPETAARMTLPAEEDPVVTAIESEADDSQLEGSADTAMANSPADQPEREEFADAGPLLAQVQTEPEAAPETDADAIASMVDDEPEVTSEEVSTQEEAEFPVAEDEQAEDALTAELPDDATVDTEVEVSSEPPETPETAPPSEAVQRPASTGRDYHIIVASFPTQATAQAHAESISDAEISAYVIAPFGTANNYRVAVASYASLAEARQNIPGLRAVYGEGIWPLRYPPATGISLISTQTGETFIIVASFPTEQLARTHANGLIAAGEQPTIIAPYPPSNRYRVAVARFDNTESAQTALPALREEYGEDSWLLRY